VILTTIEIRKRLFFCMYYVQSECIVDGSKKMLRFNTLCEGERQNTYIHMYIEEYGFIFYFKTVYADEEMNINIERYTSVR